MGVMPGYQNGRNTPSQSLFDELPGLSDLWNYLAKGANYAPSPDVLQITAPSPYNPATQRDFSKDFTAIDALNQIAREGQQNTKLTEPWQQPQYSEPWPNAPIKGMSGPTTIGPADTWYEAKRQADTAPIDIFSSTLGDLLEGRKRWEGASSLANVLGDIAGSGGEGLLAKLAGVGGMVRMGGQDVANAFLHRRIKNPEELNWLAKIFQRGESTQKPTSLVTPGYLPTFRSDEFGVMFHGPQDKIAHAGLEDIFSHKETLSPYDKSRQHLIDRVVPNLGPEPDISHSYDNWVDWWTRIQDRYPAVAQAMRNISDLKQMRKAFTTEAWNPTITDNLISPKDTPVTDFFSQLRELIGKYPSNSMRLHHNEIIPNIDRSMLAGVRVPNAGASDLLSPQEGELYRSLKNFAEQQGVPFYQWPADWQRPDQFYQLLNPMQGSWIGSGTADNPFTSSEVSRLLGKPGTSVPKGKSPDDIAKILADIGAL